MGNIASQATPPQPRGPETETIEVETVTTPKFTPPDPIPEHVSDEQDLPQGSEMESDDYHKISTQLTHTTTKINRQILALTLQDKTYPPSSRVGKGMTGEEYAYDDGEVQLRTILLLGDSNWSDGSGKEAPTFPGAQGVMCRNVRSSGLVDLRPDSWVIDDELQTWVGSGTQPDGFYYAYSDGAKILNAIVYHPRQRQFVHLKNGKANIIQELPITFSHLEAFHKFSCYQCGDPLPPKATSAIGLEWDDSIRSESDSRYETPMV